ncbi:hypothetical protein [Streptomyces sp. NPDC096323]|uniref:phage tail sheath family protein n=1 Tax=Streptomyces sp. NPDC096323 TaxID=3155822 RepID=UPI00332C0697
MALNIGVNVREVDGRAAPTVVAAPVSVTGFLLRAERGIPHTPVALRGLNDFAAYLGSHLPGVHGSHAVRGFFDNGGTEAYAVRVVDPRTSIVAQVELPDHKGVPSLKVGAGSRGRDDPGAWGNSLSVRVAAHPRATVAVPAQLLGRQQEPFALQDGHTLVVTVDDADTTVTFRPDDFGAPGIGAASAADVAAAVARQTTAFRAVPMPDGGLLLVASAPGPSSRLRVAGSAAERLGFRPPAPHADHDGDADADADAEAGSNDSAGSLPQNSSLAALEAVGGLAVGSAVIIESRGLVVAPSAMASAIAEGAAVRVTVDGAAVPVDVTFQKTDFAGQLDVISPRDVVAAVNRQARGFTAWLAQDRLVLVSDRYGAGSAIAVAAGATDATAALGLTDAVPVAGAAERKTVARVSETGRYVIWNSSLSVQVPTNVARVRSAEFDLVVSRDGREVERFEALSMQSGLDWFVGTVVNDQQSGSRFITVTDQDSASGPVDDVPADGTYVLGSTTPGTDGDPPSDLDFIGDPAARTGLFAFDTVAIQLLACPDSASAGVVNACLGYVERRGDAMFVGAPPSGMDLEAIKNYASAFRSRKSYGALYAPWIHIVNPLDLTGADPRLLVPPVGHVLGTYARIAEARGVWKAPAGDEALLASALAVEFAMTDADHTDLVKEGGVNGVRAVAGAGVIIDASRTLSTDPRWFYVNVRRLFNHVKSSLREGLRWVPQEPHSEELRRRVKFNVVTPFLLGLWRQGAFGSDPAEASFTVKCDAENNPPEDVNVGNFKVEVLFYPARPTETILIVVGQQDSGAAAAEA